MRAHHDVLHKEYWNAALGAELHKMRACALGLRISYTGDADLLALHRKTCGRRAHGVPALRSLEPSAHLNKRCLVEKLLVTAVVCAAVQPLCSFTSILPYPGRPAKC